MSFTRALAKRVSSHKPGRRPAPPPPPNPNYGLAISPATSGRKPGTGVGLDHIVRSPVGAPPFVVRNIPPSSPERRPSPPAAQQQQQRSPPVPPMSPRRALSSFNFLPQDTIFQQQQQQQQQPSRPTLALAIPQRASTHGGRDSVITEFAEDGEDGSGPGSALIWRPPQSADPANAAAATYYVADRWGNWVLRNSNNNNNSSNERGHQPSGSTVSPPEGPVAELATPISKTRDERAREEERVVDELVAESAAVRELRHYSSPTVPEALMVGSNNKRASAAGRATIRLVTPESGRLPMNSRARSSIYSSHPSLQQFAVVTPGPDNPMPQQPTLTEAMLRGGGGGGGGGGFRRRSSTRNDQQRPAAPERQTSRDSATTIMSVDSVSTDIADSSPVEDMINAALDDLVFPQPSRQLQRSSLQQQQQQQQQGTATNNRNLSPVVESPAPAPGRASPVRYPQIPPAQSNSSTATSNNKYQALGPNKRPLPNPLLVRLAAQEQQQPLKDSPTLGALAAQQQQQSRGRQGSPPSLNNQQQHQRKPSDRALLPSQRLSVYDAYNDPVSSSSAAAVSQLRAPYLTPRDLASSLPPPPAQILRRQHLNLTAH